MASLIEKLPLADQRQEIVSDCCTLLDSEVKKKTGLKGLLVKGGYKVLKAIKPGAVREAVNGLLDDFLQALEPFHTDYEKKASQTFGQSMKGRISEVAEALVQVTDRKAKSSKHKGLAKMYKKMRPSAINNVAEAIPGLADLMDKHYLS